MNSIELPLLSLFNHLRNDGLTLGVEDYIILLRALQSGIGTKDKQSLKELCCTLWAKSDADKFLIDSLLKQTIEFSTISEDKSSISKLNLDININTPPEISSPPKGSAIEESVLSSIGLQVIETKEPVQVVQAFRRRISSQDEEYKRPAHLAFDEYFPVTRRQMKQSWRYLRRMVREGLPEELDIDATIGKFASTGVLAELVFIPLRLNRAELVLMIDQDGSMVPFHAFTRQLIHTASRGGRLRDANVYYFHDYPERFLYNDSTRLAGQPVVKVLKTIGEKTHVLIVSDAGAARGGYDIERSRKTTDFIRQLQLYVRRIAWLNPMPYNRWRNTTAYDIAAIVPMFEMSRKGLDSAISTLRGRYYSE